MYSLANASCKANAIATLSPKPRGSHHGDVAPLSETALELLEQARDTTGVDGLTNRITRTAFYLESPYRGCGQSSSLVTKSCTLVISACVLVMRAESGEVGCSGA